MLTDPLTGLWNYRYLTLGARPRDRARQPIHPAARGADARPRPLQGDQRPVRAPGRRRGAHRARRPHAGRGPRGRHGRAIRRRGIRHRAARDRRGRRRPARRSARHRHQVVAVLRRPRSRGRSTTGLGSPSRPRSASPSSPNTARHRPACCAAPTTRCTPRRTPAATAGGSRKPDAG